MASPFLRHDWSIEEAVLLAQASEDIANSSVSKDDVITNLSLRLRSGAEAMGLTISQNFRNKDDVSRNLQLMGRMQKMVDFFEEDYFEGSTVGQAAILSKKNRDEFHRILDSAMEKYPFIDIPFVEESELSVTVAEPQVGYTLPRRKRPRISVYRTNFSDSTSNQGPVATTFLNKPESKEPTKNIATSQIVVQGNSVGANIDTISVTEQRKEEPPSGYQKHLGLIRQVLAQNFPRGYRMGSAIEMKRYRLAYKSLHGRNMTLSDEILEGYIRSAGFEYDGKVYLIEKVMSSQVLEAITQFIDNTFALERSYIFFKNLYDHFKDELLETMIADEEMLRLYLQSIGKRHWYFNKKFISSRPNTSVSVKDELVYYAKNACRVVTYDEIIQAFDFLPKDKVDHEWGTNNDIFISNGRNERFHIDTFYVTEQQLNEVSYLIATALETSPFVSADALLEEIRLHVSDIFSNNVEISNIGIRNALANRLANRYAFRNNLISSHKDALDGPAAMVAYAKSKGTFTMTEAEAMADLIGGAVNFYLEKIAEVSVRVDEEHFVPKEAVHFDSDGIDKALDVLTSGTFTPIANITLFESFPSCGEYPWNPRLLESYLLNTSKRYRYIRKDFLGKETMAGAIVKADSPIKDYDGLLIQALGESDVPLEETTAMNYLYDIGLIAKRSKNGIVKNILTKAKECRNRLKQKNNSQTT